MANQVMDPFEILEVESASSFSIDLERSQTKLFSMKLRTFVSTAKGREIRVVQVSNVFSFSCICLNCGEDFVTKSSLESHMDIHLQNDEDSFNPSVDHATVSMQVAGGDGLSLSPNMSAVEDVTESESVEREVPKDGEGSIDGKTLDMLDDNKDVDSAGNRKSLDAIQTCSVSEDQIKPNSVKTAEPMPQIMCSVRGHGQRHTKSKPTLPGNNTNIGPSTVEKESPTDLCKPSSLSEHPQKDTQKIIAKSKQTRRKKEPMKCNICGRIFRLKRTLIEHMNVHTGEKPCICDICGKAYSSKKKLNVHAKNHKGGEHSCQECGKGFVKSWVLREHMLVHTGEKPHLCSICGKRFRLSGQATAHMKIHSVEKPHICPICGKAFSRSSYLKQHSRMHRDVCVMCSVCGKSFKYLTGLNQHMRSEHGDQQMLECEVCGKVLKGWCTYKIHCRRHNEEKPHVCSECGKRFRVKGDMNRHRLIHNKEKQYSCSECGKSFCQKFYFEEHLRIHTGEKPLICSQCGQTFRVRAVLRKHLKTQHQKTMGSE